MSASATATNGDQTSKTNYDTSTGNVSNGGITINPGGFSFDAKNPVHLAGAALAAVLVTVLTVKALK